MCILPFWSRYATIWPKLLNHVCIASDDEEDDLTSRVPLGLSIALPTETVYGLAGIGYSNKAIKKIFISKKRVTIIYFIKIEDL